MRFLLGGYGPDMGGLATGIGLLQSTSDAGIRSLAFTGDAVTTPGSPSWVARHPSLDVFYAALEGQGAVQAFRRTGEAAWAAFGPTVAVGDLVCHVAVSPDGRMLLAACWGDGRVVGIGLDDSGGLREAVVAQPASDPYSAVDMLMSTLPAENAEPRQSRSHQSTFLPGGLIATTDLGFDLVRFWRRGADAGALRLVQEVALPLGAGPRHLLWHPSGHLYVVTEQSNEVFVLAAREDRWSIVSSTVLSPAAMPGDAAAEITLGRDGDHVYAGVRGTNTIATLRVRGDGSQLQPLALTEAGVDWPRHHVVVHDLLAVAGQRSDTVATFFVDIRTGVPGPRRTVIEVPSPTQLLLWAP